MKKKLFSVVFAIVLICVFSSLAFALPEGLSQAGEIAKENASEVPDFSIEFDENGEFDGFDVENADSFETENNVENGIDDFEEFNNEDFPEYEAEDFDFEDYFEKDFDSDKNRLTQEQTEKILNAMESNPLFSVCIVAESICIILFIPLLILLIVFIVLNSKQKKKIKEYERRIATGFGLTKNRTIQFGSQQFATSGSGGYEPYNNTGYASENGAYNENGTSPVDSDGNKQNSQENDETGGNENE